MSDVIVCGFGWSGSGAVIDFLLDQNQFQKFPGGETQFIKYKGGLDHLYKSFLKYGFIDELSMSNFARLMSAQVKAETGVDKNCNKHIRTLARLGGAAFNESVISLLTKAIRHAHEPSRWFKDEEVTELLGGFFERIAAVFRQGTNRLVFDQAIRPTNIRPLEFINSPAIIVRRDPRDSYFERKKLQINNKPTLDKFVDNYIYRQERASRTLTKYRHLSDRIYQIQFEDFVSNPETRMALCSWLGIDTPNHGGKLFRPELSQRNIGVYRTDPNVDEYRYIEDKLGKYLWRGT